VGTFVQRKPERVTPPCRLRAFAPALPGYTVVAGPREGRRLWQPLGLWLVRQGYSPGGPPMEIWLDGPKTAMRLAVVKRSKR
jgi:hypothetical protein